MLFRKKSELQKVLDEKVSKRAVFIRNIKEAEERISTLRFYIKRNVKEIERGRDPQWAPVTIRSTYNDLFYICERLGVGMLDILSKMNNLKGELEKAKVLGLDDKELQSFHNFWKNRMREYVRQLINESERQLA